MILAEFPEIQRLTTEEKLQLVGEIWDSIGPAGGDLPPSEEVKALLDERWKAHLDHPEDVLTLEQLMERVERERRK